MSARSETRVVEPSDPGLVRLLDGVVLDAGHLKLAAVPGGPEALGPPLEMGAVADPAGIAEGPGGAIYVADPAGDRVLGIAACGDSGEPARRLGPAGAGDAGLRAPRGLAVAGEHLVVADAGNRRLVELHLPSGALRAVVRPPSGPGRPWDLAVGGDGALYVIEREPAALLRLTRAGADDGRFAAAVAAQVTAPRDPLALAVGVLDGEERILVLDAGSDGRARLLAYDPQGALDADRTAAWTEGLAGAAPAPSGAGGGGVAIVGGKVVVADRAGGLWCLRARGGLLGAIDAPAASGLAGDRCGRTLVRPVGPGPALRLGAPVAAGDGSFRLGPVPVPAPGARPAPVRLSVDAMVPVGAGLRLYALATERGDLVPPPLPPDGGSAVPDAWWAAPEGATDTLLAVPGRLLWIGARLAPSPEATSARITALRVGACEDWAGHLPAVYAREDESGLLARLLAVLEGGLAEQERLIDDLPVLLDAERAPDGAWVAWLAGWLGTELGDRPRGPARRELVARAFALHGRRGTAGGLRELVRLVMGIEVDVVEPPPAPVWTLGRPGARLGAGTGLAVAAPDGAILGSTATLGASHLLAAGDRGRPLAARSAHRVTVRVRAQDLATPADRAALEEIVAREAPAHVAAHVCPVEPLMRVGLQASVGIDAVVAREGGPLALGGEGARLGAAALAAGRDRSGGAVGARLGAGLLVT